MRPAHVIEAFRLKVEFMYVPCECCLPAPADCCLVTLSHCLASDARLFIEKTNGYCWVGTQNQLIVYRFGNMLTLTTLFGWTAPFRLMAQTQAAIAHAVLRHIHVWVCTAVVIIFSVLIVPVYVSAACIPSLCDWNDGSKRLDS